MLLINNKKCLYCQSLTVFFRNVSSQHTFANHQRALICLCIFKGSISKQLYYVFIQEEKKTKNRKKIRQNT